MDGFQYDFSIDDINELREKGIGMYEAKKMLKIKCLINSANEHITDPCTRHILIEILKLINS